MFKTPLKETKPCGGMPDVLLPCGKEKESLQYVYPRRMGTKYFCSVIRKKSDRELRFNLRKNPALAKLLKSDRELRSSAPEKDPAQEPPKEVKIDDEDDDTTEAKKSMFKTPLKETKPCGGMPDVLLPCGKEKESPSM